MSDEEVKKTKAQMTARDRYMEKKKRLKAMFDNEYDDADGGSTYYDELKAAVTEQAEVSRKRTHRSHLSLEGVFYWIHR